MRHFIAAVNYRQSYLLLQAWTNKELQWMWCASPLSVYVVCLIDWQKVSGTIVGAYLKRIDVKS